jgi:crossover junction endodeoxyribonuclease RuvC
MGRIVLGVDPSMTATGLATRDEAGTFETKPDAWRGRDLARLQYIAGAVLDAAKGADLVVMEGLAFASKSGKAGDRAGLHWLIRDRLDGLGVPVAIVPPTSRAKYATGKGNAGKDAVLIEVVRRLPVQVANNNEADAVVLLAMGLDHLGEPLAVMPACTVPRLTR